MTKKTVRIPAVRGLHPHFRHERPHMIGWLRENLIDEFVAAQLLRQVFRYREHPPISGENARTCPELFRGERGAFLGPTPCPVDWRPSAAASPVRPGFALEDFEFPSSMTTTFPENNRVICRRWFNPHRPTERCVAGVDGIVQFGTRWFHQLAKLMVPKGWDVVMLDAPFNHRRTPAGYRPGQLILGGDLDHQLGVSRQSIRDLWTLVVSLQARYSRVGLVGVSYGAWMATNVAQLADGLDFLQALAPPLEMSALVFEGRSIIRALRRGLGDVNLDRRELERIGRPISPWYHELRLPPGRATFHAPRFDRFVPVARIVDYATHHGTNLVRHPLGHITATCGMGVMRQIAAAID